MTNAVNPSTRSQRTGSSGGPEGSHDSGAWGGTREPSGLDRWREDAPGPACESERCGHRIDHNGLVGCDGAWCSEQCVSAWFDEQHPNSLRSWRVLAALGRLLADERAQHLEERE